MHLHWVANVIYKKDFKYYESYPHIALVCFVCLYPEKKDSRIKTYFPLNIQFPCHIRTLNCWSPWSIAITLMVCNDNQHWWQQQWSLVARVVDGVESFEVEMMSCEVDETWDKINHAVSLVTGQEPTWNLKGTVEHVFFIWNKDLFT
jgi:hypothetical protein